MTREKAYIDKILRPSTGNITMETPIDILERISTNHKNERHPPVYGSHRMYIWNHGKSPFPGVMRDRESIMMGHTRWATHGKISIENTHPFLSYNKRFVLVHNGIISNYLKILDILRKHMGMDELFYRGQTDSEVLVHFVALCFEKPEIIDGKSSYHDIMDRIFSRVKGNYAIILIDLDINRLYIGRASNPLVLQYNEESVIISSETGSLDPTIGKFIEIPEREWVSIDAIDDTGFHIVQKTEPVWIPCPMEEEKSCNDTQYQTILEIMDQNRLWADIIGAQRVAHPMDADHIILIGCGSSFFAGTLAKKWLHRGTTASTIQCYQAFEFDASIHIPTIGKTFICLLTQSGETFDILQAARLIPTRPNIKVVSMTNVPTSSIARMLPESIFIRAGIERGVAATKSFTMQVMTLLAHFGAAGLLSETSVPAVVRELEKIHNQWIHDDQSGMTIWLRSMSIFQSIFILCREVSIALEGSLKMKELAYIHAEGYHTGSLKHGPFAMLDGKTAGVIMVCLDSQKQMEDWAVYQEVSSRDTLIFCIVTDRHDVFLANTPDSNRAVIDSAGIHPAVVELLGVVHLQWLACKLSIHRGFHPDFPRNLAKTVTV